MSNSGSAALHHGFEPAVLDAFLRKQLGDLRGAMQLQAIGGGQSNPTYFVSYDNRRLVLRKQPGTDLVQGAHAVDREYRVINALAGSAVPVPKALLFHEDRDIVGTPFYVMERLEGRVFAGYDTPGVSPAERRAMYRSMAQTLAQLHSIDYAALGLADYGKPGNYYARQIGRWSRQWQATGTRENAALDRLIEWLPANIPPGDTTALSHGDFRMGNLMFHPTEPRVIAVLDWELSTLGHPLADLAYNCIAWRTSPDEYGGILGLDWTALGILAEAEHLADYYAASAVQEPLTAFHYAFALFRFAVIFEGIAARAQAGNAVSENAEQVGKLGLALAGRALRLID